MALSMDTDALRDAVLKLLGRVGMKVEHEELSALMLDAGCSRSATGRIRVPEGLIAELVACQEQTRAQDDDDQALLPWCGPDWTHWVMWTGQRAQVT